jgi:hypothetical protein
MRHLLPVIAFILATFSVYSEVQPSQKSPYLSFSGPEILTYEDCVQLLKNDLPTGPVAEKLRKILTTPFISNEAYLHGIRPIKRNRRELGQFLRVGLCPNKRF